MAENVLLAPEPLLRQWDIVQTLLDIISDTLRSVHQNLNVSQAYQFRPIHFITDLPPRGLCHVILTVEQDCCYVSVPLCEYEVDVTTHAGEKTGIVCVDELAREGEEERSILCLPIICVRRKWR